MKHPSLPLGDLADLFRGSRTEDVQIKVGAAVCSVSHHGRQIARLAAVAERRIQEVETKNAILGMLLVKVLNKLAKKNPKQ